MHFIKIRNHTKTIAGVSQIGLIKLKPVSVADKLKVTYWYAKTHSWSASMFFFLFFNACFVFSTLYLTHLIRLYYET